MSHRHCPMSADADPRELLEDLTYAVDGLLAAGTGLARVSKALGGDLRAELQALSDVRREVLELVTEIETNPTRVEKKMEAALEAEIERIKELDKRFMDDFGFPGEGVLGNGTGRGPVN